MAVPIKYAPCFLKVHFKEIGWKEFENFIEYLSFERSHLTPHNLNGPAFVYGDGSEEWFTDGFLHREGGPARIRKNGHKEYYKHGQLHREDGPAIIYTDGEAEWYQEGKLHRLDGPAKMHANGEEAYFLNGLEIDAKSPPLKMLDSLFQIYEKYGPAYMLTHPAEGCRLFAQRIIKLVDQSNKKE